MALYKLAYIIIIIITGGEFVLGIVMSLPAINLLDSLSKAVQSRSVAISGAVSAMEVTYNGLEGLRTEEAFYGIFVLVSSAVKSWVLRLLNYVAFVTGQRGMKLDLVQITSGVLTRNILQFSTSNF